MISNTILVSNIKDLDMATANNRNLKLESILIRKESPYVTIDTTNFMTKVNDQKEIGNIIQIFD